MEKKEIRKEKFSNFMNKASDMGKKAADEIQKGAKNLSEQTKKSLHEQKIKKYNPLFVEKFHSEEFKIPNVIKIVDDAERRDVDVCDGAIGWTAKVNEVEILFLYDEYIKESNVDFIPFAKCDNVYCVDNFERNKFICSESIFDRATNEKLAELEHIAYCLGAKSCSIEIAELNAQSNSSRLGIGAKYSAMSAKASAETTSKNQSRHNGKNVSYFEGNNVPTQPTLKWFAHDENIKGLIEMRCSGNNSIKYKVLELNCSTSATMSTKVACAIDKILKIKASVSMESKAIKEHSSKLIFEVEF